VVTVGLNAPSAPVLPLLKASAVPEMDSITEVITGTHRLN
jgi:hypothetical protein